MKFFEWPTGDLEAFIKNRDSLQEGTKYFLIAALPDEFSPGAKFLVGLCYVYEGCNNRVWESFENKFRSLDPRYFVKVVIPGNSYPKWDEFLVEVIDDHHEAQLKEQYAAERAQALDYIYRNC